VAVSIKQLDELTRGRGESRAVRACTDAESGHRMLKSNYSADRNLVHVRPTVCSAALLGRELRTVPQQEDAIR
jgi:hypothetical protein